MNLKRSKFFVLCKYILFSTTLILLMISIFNLTACENREKVIKIGSQAVLSGEDKFFGEDQLVSLKLAVSELSPVKVGGFDYRLDLVSKDDEGSAEKAFLIAQELVDENVSAVIGSTFNGTTKASVPVFAEFNIPIVTPSAQGLDIAVGYSNFFRLIMNNKQRVENIVNFLNDELKPKKLIFISNGEEYSTNLIDSMIEIFNDKKIPYPKQPYTVKHDLNEYKVLAENLLIDEPDYIFFAAKYDELADLITEVRKIGLNSQFVTEQMGMDEGISLLTNKELLEGLIAVIPEPPSLAKYSEDKKAVDFWRKYQDFVSKMKDKTVSKEGPGPYAPYSYDSLHLVIDAMKRSNSILPEDFMEELKKTSYDGIVGNIKFNSNGDRIDPPSTIFIMKNGDWVRY
ncbi:MAG: branched-chain amino acid ABC transporter substrate-binding protein [Actinobacteria bacterium]|nr:branched-chain amino acid ABC transporter substrate-binding protein [Actinomycetota bacterium]